MSYRAINPAGWPRPKGYSNGVLAQGPTLFVAGQIGWDETGRFADGFAAQVHQALLNIVAVLREAGGGPEHIVRQTWFITDRAAYIAQQKAVGEAWREVMGRHFPAMSVVEVRALIEEAALVEIEATAVLPAPGRDP